MIFFVNANKITIIHTITVSLLIILTTTQRKGNAEEKVFVFPEFDYIENTKHEIAWHEWEAACEQTPVCLGLTELKKLNCVRRCISPSCYNDIYLFDELEEGEIDIRFHSFKGCFVSRIARKRI